MRRLAGITAATVAAGLTGCAAGAVGATASRPAAPVTAPGAPAAPSVAALVHISTTLPVRDAHAPQAGVRGLVTVSSIDVAFISGGAQVGWTTGATPPGHAPLLISNGNTELAAIADNIYLYGRWAPRCRVLRVYWLPGEHG